MRIGCYYDDGRALVAELEVVSQLTGLSKYRIQKAIKDGIPVPGVILCVAPKGAPDRIPENSKI